MFNKNEFSNILKKISETYSNQTEFSKKSKIGRTYISQYINKKIDVPPKPSILKKIADSSKGITNYEELMRICGYFDTKKITNKIIHLAFLEHYNELKMFCSDDEIQELISSLNNLNGTDDITLKFNIFAEKKDLSAQEKNIFLNIVKKILLYISNYINSNILHSELEYEVKSDDMLPLLDVGDIAIIEKEENIESGKTYLIIYEEKEIIRKIIDNGDTITLQAMNPYYPIITTTKDKIKIIGKVIKAENSSAFK